jgi:hypothetical protein
MNRHSRWPGRETDHSPPPPSAEVKNAWNDTSCVRASKLSCGIPLVDASLFVHFVSHSGHQIRLFGYIVSRTRVVNYVVLFTDRSESFLTY